MQIGRRRSLLIHRSANDRAGRDDDSKYQWVASRLPITRSAVNSTLNAKRHSGPKVLAEIGPRLPASRLRKQAVLPGETFANRTFRKDFGDTIPETVTDMFRCAIQDRDRYNYLVAVGCPSGRGIFNPRRKCRGDM